MSGAPWGRWISFIAVMALTLRWVVSWHPHSGQSHPPMFGDFEAQRHWVEMSHALPPQDWYRDTPDNDLLYWGLDYPPLSAWHAKAIGSVYRYYLQATTQVNVDHLLSNETRVACAEDPQCGGQLPCCIRNDKWNRTFGLKRSRGSADRDSKLVMRIAAIITDLVFYLVPAVCFVKALVRFDCSSSSNISPLWAAGLLVVAPGLVMIDHGHFQFNSVPLGLVVMTLALSFPLPHQGAPITGTSTTSRFIIGVICIAAAIMFKQMSLYYALGMAAFVVTQAIAIGRSESVVKAMFLFVAAVVTGLSVVGLCLMPPLEWKDVLTRMFPFNRGLYEDKVANVWCSFSPILKLQNMFEKREKLLLFCSTATFTAASLGLLGYAWKYSYRCEATAKATATAIWATKVMRFGLVLTVSSLSFFLFSYQVHEKSILMVLAPSAVAALVSCWIPVVGGGTVADILIKPVFHLHVAALFSMYHLVLKDRIGPVYLSLLGFLLLVRWGLSLQEVPKVPEHFSWIHRAAAMAERVSYSIMLSVHAACTFVTPPARYPDLIPLLFALASCVQFLYFLAWFTWLLWKT